MGRPTKNAARMRKRYLEESNEERKKRLEANRNRIRLTRSQESLDQREERLSRMRSYVKNWLTQRKRKEKEHAGRLDLIRELVIHNSTLKYRKCLETAELFSQMMNEDYEPNSWINQDLPEFCNGFIKTPIEIQTESVAIKEELPADCERLDDIIEPKKEYQSDELEQENLENSFTNEDIQHLGSELDEPLTEFKVEVENHEVSRKKPKLENVITEEQEKNEQSDTKVIGTTENCGYI